MIGYKIRTILTLFSQTGQSDDEEEAKEDLDDETTESSEETVQGEVEDNDFNVKTYLLPKEPASDMVVNKQQDELVSYREQLDSFAERE